MTTKVTPQQLKAVEKRYAERFASTLDLTPDEQLICASICAAYYANHEGEAMTEPGIGGIIRHVRSQRVARQAEIDRILGSGK